jgi:hypothetical protein
LCNGTELLSLVIDGIFVRVKSAHDKTRVAVVYGLVLPMLAKAGKRF